MANWFCSAAKWAAVARWASGTVYGAGALIRNAHVASTGIYVLPGTPSTSTYNVTIGATTVSTVGNTSVQQTTDDMVTNCNASIDAGFAAITWSRTGSGSTSLLTGTADASVLVRFTTSVTGGTGSWRNSIAIPSGNERVFSAAGGTSGGTEPTWVLTRSATTADNGWNWTEVTGESGNGWNGPAYLLSRALATGWGSADGSVIFCDNANVEYLNASTTFTLGIGTRVISTSDTTNNPPTVYATGFTVDGSVTLDAAVHIALPGNGTYHGFTFKTGSGSGAQCDIRLCASDLNYAMYKDCSFILSGTHAASRISLNGIGAGTGNTQICVTKNCSFTWGSVSQGFQLLAYWESYGDDFCAGATVPTQLFSSLNVNSNVRVEGGDLSDITGTLFVASTSGCPVLARFYNCKIAAATIASLPQPGMGQVLLYDCDVGDNHYKFAHYDYFGSTIATTAVYASAKYDGTNGVSWKITSNANVSRDLPYVSPWIDVYHSGTGAITPRLEVVRSGSATPYKDSEVWSEWSYQGTSGSTRATFVKDKCGNLATPANQATGSLGAADWTGESGTSWFGKLTPTAAITPAEIGHLRVRVCVGLPTVTDLYVNPLIYDRS